MCILMGQCIQLYFQTSSYVNYIAYRYTRRHSVDKLLFVKLESLSTVPFIAYLRRIEWEVIIVVSFPWQLGSRKNEDQSFHKLYCKTLRDFLKMNLLRKMSLIYQKGDRNRLTTPEKEIIFFFKSYQIDLINQFEIIVSSWSTCFTVTI